MNIIYPMNSSNGNIATLLLLVLSLLVCSAEEDCVVIGDLCNPGSPDFDPQGAVCGNDGQPNEAYCNYSVGPNACVIGCKITCFADPGVGIPGCSCHPSCATCGYVDKPISFEDCITCADGSDVTKVWDDGTGTCGDSLTEVPTDVPTFTSTEFPTPAEVGLVLDQEEDALTTSESLNCLYGGGEFAPTSISVESLGMSGDVSCASFCWDCADSDEDDTLCTDEQRSNGAKISQFLAVPGDSLEMYASVYANYNFQSCMIDVCNSADPCGGTVGGATESPLDTGTESSVVDANEIKEDECSAEPAVFVNDYTGCVDGRVFFDNCPFDGAAALVARQTPEGVMACCPPGVTKGSVFDADEGELPFTCGSVEGDESNVQASSQDEDKEVDEDQDQETDSPTYAPTDAKAQGLGQAWPRPETECQMVDFFVGYTSCVKGFVFSDCNYDYKEEGYSSELVACCPPGATIGASDFEGLNTFTCVSSGASLLSVLGVASWLGTFAVIAVIFV